MCIRDSSGSGACDLIDLITFYRRDRHRSRSAFDRKSGDCEIVSDLESAETACNFMYWNRSEYGGTDYAAALHE